MGACYAICHGEHERGAQCRHRPIHRPLGQPFETVAPCRHMVRSELGELHPGNGVCLVLLAAVHRSLESLVVVMRAVLRLVAPPIFDVAPASDLNRGVVAVVCLASDAVVEFGEPRTRGLGRLVIVETV